VRNGFSEKGEPVNAPNVVSIRRAVNSPNSQPDFTLRDEGTLVLLTPLSASALEFMEERIGSDNGFQPYWPTVVIERRYAQDILEGAIAEGMVIA
jgi:hypothetical protein